MFILPCGGSFQRTCGASGRDPSKPSALDRFIGDCQRERQTDCGIAAGIYAEILENSS